MLHTHENQPSLAQGSGNRLRMLSKLGFKQWGEQVLQDNQGALLVYIALIFPVLITVAALAIDANNLYVQEQRMQLAADAAALAGARLVALGQSQAQVDGEIHTLATANGADTVSWTYVENSIGVQVHAMHTFPTYFAGLIGYETLSVHATASAALSIPGSMDNFLPMTTMCDDMDSDADPGFTFGQVYTFWDNDMNVPGNFGWVDWNGSSVGDSELAAAIAHPSTSGVWEVGDWLYAGPGVQNSSPIRVALDAWIEKPVTIPLYDLVTGTGSGARYRVCAFAEFILKDYNFSASNKWVRGSFVRRVRQGGRSGNPPDFGLRDFRLIQ
jgi:Putative Flp pilus-assembly TadE/G-like